MKLQRLFCMALLSLGCSTMIHAQQPLNLCCHPNDIKEWTPGSNPNDVFNVAKVPLAKRVKEPKLMKANDTQNYGGEICNSTILYPTCSLCPSQGEVNNFLAYQPTYWQYMDKLVYWAGSASEGIINIPPAGSTDAAHAQGVKSFGNIFFPPAAYGGTQEWVRQMLTRENGKYIYAVKLYQLCKYFNFDGWFINQESGGSLISEWVEFFQDFYAAAAEDGNTTVELQWYNASWYPDVTILSSHINTSQFIEYGQAGDYRDFAKKINCTEAQTFSKIYAGVQCANTGHTGWMSHLDKAMPASGEHVGSLDLFCPEVGIWENIAKPAFKSPSQNHGEGAYSIGRKVFENDEDMWVNTQSDPSATIEGYYWKGVSSRVLERSAITSMPFLSDMGVGNGKHRFVEGVIAGTADWYHSGMQSILPTWRWWIENRGDLTVDIDWDDAYNVGSSFKISGTLSAGNHLMRLYKTQIPVTAGGVYRVVYKSSAAFTLEARLSTESSVQPDVTLAPAKTTENNGWTVAEFDLSSLNGKTIYMLALNLKADADIAAFSMNLGQVAVLPANYAPASVVVNNLNTTSVLGEGKGDIRVSWDYAWIDDFDHFDIYVETVDGTRRMVGQTRGLGFYIPEFARNGMDSHVNVEVVPVMKTGKQQPAQKIKLDYPAPKPPVVTFSISPKSYCSIGQTLTLTADAMGEVTAYKWVLSEGLELDGNSSLTEKSIKVIAKTAGRKTVTVEATNTIGSSTTTAEVVDVFESPETLNEVTNVVKGKTVLSYSGATNSRETPRNIIDGITRPYSVNQKWCNISADNEVVLDCQGEYRMYGFKIYDGNAGPETGVDQIDRYTIEVSIDNENWTTVVNKEGVDAISIKEDHIAPIKARYIRLRPHVNGTLRIWEFEAFGRADNNLTVDVAPTFSVNAGETKDIVLKYNLNGDKRDEQFSCTVMADNENVTIGSIVEDRDAGTFTIPVTASQILGTSVLTIRVNNGIVYKEAIVNVDIDSDSQPNVLAGQSAILRQYLADYSFEAKHNDYEISTLTDGILDVNACDDDIQNPSKFKDDIWAIFTAPTEKGWNLSKVRITIPEDNIGISDNADKGVVNKDIKIAVGNDLGNLTVVKTFSNLQEVSTLEYIFPEFKNTKYIAVICNLNPLYYASLAEVEAFEQFEAARPVYESLPLRGWNKDVIAEDKPVSAYVDGSLDQQGWALYPKSVQAEGAVCDEDGIVTSKAGVQYQLRPFDQSNAYVLNTNPISMKMEEAKGGYEKLHFLMMSANGNSSVNIMVRYEDDEIQSVNGMVYDWYGENSAGDEAVYGLGRIKTRTGDGVSESSIDSRLKFRLYELEMSVDPTKKIASIRIDNTSFWRRTVLTLLSAVGKVSSVTDGITSVETAKSTEVVAIYSLNGMRLNTLVKGINIVKYADGTTKKIVVR